MKAQAFAAARAARAGRDPRTGEPVQIAASKQAKWKPSKRLKYELNGNQAEGAEV